ncbi:MAG: RidA family protein [Cyclobacteriaceae bacterium]|nr:RidA family protein [Cyclobacteriaceae bacterium]
MKVRMHVILVFLFVITLATSANAQGQKVINPEALSKSSGYSHVVVVGNTIYISGQVPADATNAVVGKGDLRAQVTKVYENLKICLAAAGATFDDVVKMNTYVVNYKPEDVTIIREVRKNYLSKESPPASTLVGVQALVNPDFLVEIEAMAVKR